MIKNKHNFPIKFEDEKMTEEEIKKENEIVFTGSIDETSKYLLDFINSLDKPKKEVRKRCKECNHELILKKRTKFKLVCENYLCKNYKNDRL